MTEIREISGISLAESPEREKADILPKDNPSLAVSVLFIAALILSTFNGLGLIYAVSVVNKLSDLSTKVARIDDFEQRLSRQLAVFNDGIHSQFDKLDSRLVASGLSGNSFEFHVLRNPRRLLAPTSARSGLLTATSATFEYADDPSYGTGNGFGTTADGFMPASQGTRSEMSGFSRSVTADGKIVYRKIQ